MCRNDFLLCKQIQRKDKSQENIHQNRQNRGCRAPRHSEDAASRVADQCGGFLNQQVRVYGVFGQDNVIFCSKRDNACPPPPDFLHIDRNVLINSSPDSRRLGNHHKHHSKQNPGTSTVLAVRHTGRVSFSGAFRHTLFQQHSNGRRTTLIKNAITPPIRNGVNSTSTLPRKCKTASRFTSAHANTISSTNARMI